MATSIERLLLLAIKNGGVSFTTFYKKFEKKEIKNR